MAQNAIIGLSIGYNTSSALLLNGDVAFAVEEERLIREKRTRKFPIRGVQEALKRSGLGLEDVDAFAVAWNPAINLEPFNLAQSMRTRYMGEFLYSVPNYLMTLKDDNSALLTQQVVEFMDQEKLNIYYVTHHLSHAATFFFSPFERAAIMSIDGFGEKDCVLFAEGKGNQLRTLWTQEFPHSLGSFYSAMTEFIGFKPDNDEWKLMGASSYGDRDRYYDKLCKTIHLKDSGGFELDLSYFNHYQFHRPLLYSPKMADLLDLQPNERDKPLTQEYYDLSAAAQRITEEVYFHLLRHLHELTGLDDVVLAGGVVYNSVANGKILQETPFKNAFIPPVPDDSGGALGAAFYMRHQVWKQPREYVMTSNYFGPGYSDDEIESQLKTLKLSYVGLDDPAQSAAELVAAGKIVGWFQGRLEFGDRALGNRSILADPRDSEMKDKVNNTVKYREPFRPFAPSALADKIDDYFIDAVPAPYMERVFPIRPEKQAEIPAVTHVDGSGRLQTVTEESNPLYWRMIDSFHKITGVPLVLNTSFNLKGEPIVCSPQDALRTFYSSGLDALVIGGFLVEK
jgi:carbamoyltransferase